MALPIQVIKRNIARRAYGFVFSAMIGSFFVLLPVGHTVLGISDPTSPAGKKNSRGTH